MSASLFSIPKDMQRCQTFDTPAATPQNEDLSFAGLPFSISALDGIPRHLPNQDQDQALQNELPPKRSLAKLSPFCLMTSACSPFATVCAEVGAALSAGDSALEAPPLHVPSVPPPPPRASMECSINGPSTDDTMQESGCSLNLTGMLTTTLLRGGQPPPCLAAQASTVQQAGGPPHGVKAVCGRRSEMEDTFSVQTNFFDLPSPGPAGPPAQLGLLKLPPRMASQQEEIRQSHVPMDTDSTAFGAPDTDAGSMGSSSCSDGSNSSDTLHFFGVYDGHGGVDAASHCANRLHHHLYAALMLRQQRAGELCGFVEPAAELCNKHASPAKPPQQQPPQPLPQPQPQDPDPGNRDDEPVLASSARPGTERPCSDGCAPLPPGAEGAAPEAAPAATDESPLPSPPGQEPCHGDMLEEALCDAFRQTDLEFGGCDTAAIAGTTAVVALLGRRQFWVANCGDSRAVLCRAGKAVQLTDDHKPERQDEAERVERAGGHVLYWNGHRVMGVLAMSRAIGDHGLRPFIIPDPEISVVPRSAGDDFLLLASDGLWDVMSNQETTDLVSKCLARAVEKGASRKAAVRVAASVLTKAAIDRGSKDNITVVIIDLKSYPEDKAAASALPASAKTP